MKNKKLLIIAAILVFLILFHYIVWPFILKGILFLISQPTKVMGYSDQHREEIRIALNITPPDHSAFAEGIITPSRDPHTLLVFRYPIEDAKHYSSIEEFMQEKFDLNDQHYIGRVNKKLPPDVHYPCLTSFYALGYDFTSVVHYPYDGLVWGDMYYMTTKTEIIVGISFGRP